MPQSSVNNVNGELKKNYQKVKEWIVGNCIPEYINLAKTEQLQEDS